MTRKITRLITIFAVLAASCLCPAWGQPQPAPVRTADMMDDVFGEGRDSGRSLSPSHSDDRGVLNGNPAIEASYNNYRLLHTKRSYTFQFYSSIFIFFLVVSIVLMGLYLSYRQFLLQEWKTKQPPTVVAEAKIVDDAAVTTTFEVGKDGIKINSAVIGLIILTISLVFFFLYLKYVYPITMDVM